MIFLDKLSLSKIAEKEMTCKSNIHQKKRRIVEKLAKIYGISVRQGWFCAHPYCRRLMHISEKTATNFIYDERVKMPGMIRVSFGIYNTKEEVDYFLEAVEKISKIFR